jgi:hypothetical protein
MDLDQFFTGYEHSRSLFDRLLIEIESLVPSAMRITKTQIAFSRRKSFAWLWIPEKHLHRKAAPVVLSLSFPQRDLSSRWKEIVEPYRGRFMHHLELFTSNDIDEQVRDWLRAAWEAAA